MQVQGCMLDVGMWWFNSIPYHFFFFFFKTFIVNKFFFTNYSMLNLIKITCCFRLVSATTWRIRVQQDQFWICRFFRYFNFQASLNNCYISHTRVLDKNKCFGGKKKDKLKFEISRIQFSWKKSTKNKKLIAKK